MVFGLVGAGRSEAALNTEFYGNLGHKPEWATMACCLPTFLEVPRRKASFARRCKDLLTTLSAVAFYDSRTPAAEPLYLRLSILNSRCDLSPKEIRICSWNLLYRPQSRGLLKQNGMCNHRIESGSEKPYLSSSEAEHSRC